MVDGWMGDDWFHNGAFRKQMMGYIYDQEASRKSDVNWWQSHHDEYDMFMQAGSAGELGWRRGLEQVGFWRKLLEHPSYDAFWRDQAVDRLLAAQPPTIPVMLVHSLWDQEDIYGAVAVYNAIEPKDTANDAPKADVPPVTAFETGTNTWRRLTAWPAGCTSGCTLQPTPLYLAAGLKLDVAAPKAGDAAFEEYVSDPAKPVPYRARPIQPAGGGTWAQWLVDDQWEASGRPDVAVFVSDVLKAPLKISGQPKVNLIASTSGTDADWVVKVIDVYPDEVAAQPQMGGYQLMVSADIFRGRYREGFETPKPIAADRPLLYRFPLPTANHVFLPGHRMMVQVQSSWFPLYDRNPQTFVPSIFRATPSDYKKASQRIYHAPGQASFIELPIVVTK
jgi:uncharacterized protein